MPCLQHTARVLLNQRGWLRDEQTPATVDGIVPCPKNDGDLTDYDGYGASRFTITPPTLAECWRYWLGYWAGFDHHCIRVVISACATKTHIEISNPAIKNRLSQQGDGLFFTFTRHKRLSKMITLLNRLPKLRRGTLGTRLDRWRHIPQHKRSRRH